MTEQDLLALLKKLEGEITQLNTVHQNQMSALQRKHSQDLRELKQRVKGIYQLVELTSPASNVSFHPPSTAELTSTNGKSLETVGTAS
jgi:hypothetical protein